MVTNKQNRRCPGFSRRWSVICHLFVRFAPFDRLNATGVIMVRHKLHIIISLALCAGAAFAGREIALEDNKGFIYLPKKFDPAKTYWVVAGIHGADHRSRGACGMAGWADKKDVIVISPQYPKDSGYQNCYPKNQDRLIKLFKDVQKKYKVHPKMFIYGYSGGSQFAHRFVLYRPEYVCGVSSHSGGSWATGRYQKLGARRLTTVWNG
jgi:poly(3-hydroxybutyrate) depolymerase